MKREPQDRLKELIARLVLKFSFSGYVFSNVRRIQNPYLPSIMGVAIMQDGSISLMYHPELLEKTDDENVTWVLEHELLHLLLKHPLRGLRIIASETDPVRIKFKEYILNIAGDCSCNEQGKLPKALTIAGESWKLHFAENHGLPKGLTTEAMYYKLLEKNEKQFEEMVSKIKADIGKGKGKKGKSKGKDSKEGKGLVFVPGQGVFEVEMPPGYENDKNIDFHGKWTDAAQSEADIGALSRKADAQITNVIKESVKQFERRRGTLPGNYAELIAKALEPPMAPYYQIISRYVRASKLSKFKRSPTMINRKRTYVFKDDNLPLISPFPGRKRDFSFKIAILLDTSGSMQPDDIREGLSGTKHIIEKDKYCETTILEVDTQVEKEYKCKRIKDIQFNIKGRGGTTLGPGLFRAKELGVDVCLVFTDAATEQIRGYNRKTLPKKMVFVVPKEANVDTVKGLGPIVRIKK